MEDETKNKANVWQKQGAITRPSEARIPLIDVSELSEDQRTLASIGASNVLRVLAHRGDLMAAWLDFGSALTTGGRISMRTRELLILRVALHASCEYEWANHVPGALSAGRTASEIASLAEGTGSWSDADMAVLNLVDDLCVDDCASEQTWKALKITYDEGEIIELLMLIGFYRLNAGVLNSLGVQAEPGRPRLGQGMSYEAPVSRQQPTGALSDVKPEGTWHLKFYHPAATQELELVIVMKDGVLSGSLTNEAAGITVPISKGEIQGHRIIGTTIMTKPFPVTITWDGTINGDYLGGLAELHGIGSFPFDGTRIG